jgi:hypothetical protein
MDTREMSFTNATWHAKIVALKTTGGAVRRAVSLMQVDAAMQPSSFTTGTMRNLHILRELPHYFPHILPQVPEAKAHSSLTISLDERWLTANVA